MSPDQTEPDQIEDNVAEQSPAILEPALVEPEEASGEPEAVAEDAEQTADEPEAVVEGPAEELAPAEAAQAELTTEPTPAPESPEPAVIVATELPRWPFVAYDIVWLAFSGLLAWWLSLAPKDASIYSLPLYPVALFTGVALAVAGPVLAFSVWMSVRKAPWRRPGMFATAMFLGALATLVGVVLWWAGLSIGDVLRLR